MKDKIKIFSVLLLILIIWSCKTNHKNYDAKLVTTTLPDSSTKVVGALINGKKKGYGLNTMTMDFYYRKRHMFMTASLERVLATMMMAEQLLRGEPS